MHVGWRRSPSPAGARSAERSRSKFTVSLCLSSAGKSGKVEVQGSEGGRHEATAELKEVCNDTSAAIRGC